MGADLKNARRSFLEPLGLDKERLMSFSDGIFTIAITLLILEIRLPEIPSAEIDARFLESMVAISPKILGLILSFFIIAMYWLSYHRIFHFIREIDRILVQWNTLFLFCIVFMPFPTYLLGLYGDHYTIVIFYAANIAVSSAILSRMWIHASKGHHLIDPDLDDDFIRYLSIRSLIPVAVFALSIFIAIFSPLLAMLAWVLNFFVVYVIYSRFNPLIL
ncbi:MAG: TMEM175 family protein [Methanomicrobiales archaeon]|jgi:uncharacterized membrane protein